MRAFLTMILFIGTLYRHSPRLCSYSFCDEGQEHHPPASLGERVHIKVTPSKTFITHGCLITHMQVSRPEMLFELKVIWIACPPTVTRIRHLSPRPFCSSLSSNIGDQVCRGGAPNRKCGIHMPVSVFTQGISVYIPPYNGSSHIKLYHH